MADESEAGVFGKSGETEAEGIEAIAAEGAGAVAGGADVVGIGAIALAAAEEIDGDDVVVGGEVPIEIAPHAAVGEDAMDEDDGAIVRLSGVYLIFVKSNFERMVAGGVECDAVGGHLDGGSFGFDGREIGDAVFGGESGCGLAANQEKRAG